MIKQFLFLLIGLALGSTAHSQLNMSLVGHVDYTSLHSVGLNDCWGYVDETGIEYALVGTTAGTSIVSLQNPATPTEVFWEPGTQSIWRDLQVYGDYAYITTEADDGLLIIDMSTLPASTALTTTYYFGPNINPWSSAHDIFIDTLGGWAYICGANRGNGGLIILDIHTDPMNPIEVGIFDNWYCHDAYAQGNLLYGAHIAEGILAIIDVSDHANPVLLNTQITPNSFTHNVWVTSDDNYAVTTDEIAGSYLTLYDVNNPNNIQEVDRIRSSPGLNIIPHNAFILDDSLIVSSYYTDGITMHDMSRPNNLVEIGNYDTHPLETGTFNGSWGAYPFLPSGLMLASDMSEGLFVIQPTILPAAYYEGLVRDALSLAVLPDVSVTMELDPQTDLTDALGKFAVGTVVPGVKNVTFYKVAYYPQTIPVNFVNGVLELDTIDLVPIPPFPLTVNVVDEFLNPIIGADVRIEVPQMIQEGQTNGFGDHDFQLYYPGNSTITAGKWGYHTECGTYNLDGTTGTVTIQLPTGFYDDFSFDFGWTTTTDTATTGFWERGIPNTAADNAAPPEDAMYDCNGYAFLTGNAETISSDFDDVDGGRVNLYSPVFDLSTHPNPYIYFELWFFNQYGPGLIDDTLKVYISNGVTQVLLQQLLTSGFSVSWQPESYYIPFFITPTANMQLRITTADLGDINVTEGGFDLFMITDQPVLSLTETNEFQLQIFPNPTNELLNVVVSGEHEYQIFTPTGTMVQQGEISTESAVLDVSHLAQGVYFFQVGEEVIRFIKE